MKSITIITQSHICRNPRVWKEGQALAKKGYKVVILTTFYDEKLYKEDLRLLNKLNIEYKCYADLRRGKRNTLQQFYLKVLRRLGVWLTKYKIKNSALALGYGPKQLYNMALKQNADLYICHQEMASYIGTKLLQNNKKVAFDIEDWYSEDLLPMARKARPIKLLKKIEQNALATTLSWTTSEIMAQKMAAVYKTNMPAVVYNTFPKRKKKEAIDYKDRVDHSKASLFWFSQTIGPGRGLEVLISALHHIEQPLELHLRGNISASYRSLLEEKFPDKGCQTLHFHSLVLNEELPARIAEHDIGLALESKEPLSRNYTITNKILQYLEAGVAVIASKTEGQIEVAVLAPEAVFLFEQEKSLIDAIKLLLSNRDLLVEAKSKARQSYLKSFLWEKQEEKLCQLIEAALSN